MGELQTQVRLLTAKCESQDAKIKLLLKQFRIAESMCKCGAGSKKVSKTKTKKSKKSVKSEKVETGDDPLG